MGRLAARTECNGTHPLAASAFHRSPALAPRPRGRVPAVPRSLQPAGQGRRLHGACTWLQAPSAPARAPQDPCPARRVCTCDRSIVGTLQTEWLSLLRVLYKGRREGRLSKDIRAWREQPRQTFAR